MRVTRARGATRGAQEVTCTECGVNYLCKGCRKNTTGDSVPRKFLLDLQLSHLPRDVWFIVPAPKMDLAEYPAYSSPLLLSTMLGVDGALFHELLFQEKKKAKRGGETFEAFLKKKYNVQAVKFRSKVIFINFRRNALFDHKEINISSVPDFCKEPITKSKTLLAASNEQKLTKEIVTGFVASLGCSGSPDETPFLLHFPNAM